MQSANPPADQPANVHATGVVLGTTGLLIVGPSGSGKTSLAQTLIDAWKAGGRFARLIADDQVFLSVRHGKLLATAPETTAGLVEIVGLGPRPAKFLPAAVIDAQCRLVPFDDAPRFQEPYDEELRGLTVPTIKLPMRDSTGSVRAITGLLGDAGRL